MIACFAKGIGERTPAAKLLRSELLRAGISPARVKFREPGDSMADATYILAMGTPSLHGVTRAENLTTDRGKFWPHPATGAFVMLTFHPSYVLRRKSAARLFRDDVQAFAALVLLDLGEGERLR